MKEIMHFATTADRIAYLKHGFDEIVPEKVEKAAEKAEKTEKPPKKASKAKKSKKKEVKEDEVQAE